MTRHVWRSRSGSLLVITLWLITILSMFAVAIARYLSVQVRLTKYRLAREQAKVLAHGGVYLAMQRLVDDSNKDYDWLGDDWSHLTSGERGAPAPWVVRLEGKKGMDPTLGNHVNIQVTDEERRLDINAASESVLKELLTQLRLSPDLATAIVNYTNPNSKEEPTQQPPYYYPKKSRMAVLEELTDIPGVNQTVADLRPQLTAWLKSSGTPTVNINTATREVLMTLGAGASPPVAEAVEKLIVSRPGPDGVFGNADDCKVIAIDQAAHTATMDPPSCDPSPWNAVLKLSTATFGANSATFRIQVEALIQPQQVRHRIEAIVRRKNSKDGSIRPTILAWREG